MGKRCFSYSIGNTTYIESSKDTYKTYEVYIKYTYRKFIDVKNFDELIIEGVNFKIN